MAEHTVKPEDMEIGQRYRVDTVEGECVNKLGKTMVIVTDKGIRLPVSADAVVTKVVDHKVCEKCGKDKPLDEFQKVKGGNYRKTCKECGKKGKRVFEPVEDTQDPESPALFAEKPESLVPADTPDTDPIQPNHYRQGKTDLFETWYLTYPFNEFRAIMKSHIAKYLHRYQDKNGTEDLDKASYCIQRLREYEECEANE
jgi:hypothetical protein|nr:MAG TPA: nucelotide kinase [Caudoviricetes sp.]